MSDYARESHYGPPTPGKVLELIRTGQATTRSELAAATGRSRSTVSERLEVLVQADLVRPGGEEPSTGGRPATRFALNASAGVVLVADLGATHCRVAAMDLAGVSMAETASDLLIAEGPDVVLPWVVDTFDQLLEEVRRPRDHVVGVAIGVPGPVEFAVGRPVAPPIMPGWDGVKIPEIIRNDFLGVPVLVDNDVNIMAMGEYDRKWKSTSQDFLFVKVGTGIGSGIISQGRIHRGAAGTAGDIGHIRVSDDPAAPICRCGNRGCVEAVAGGAALARQLTEMGMSADNSRDAVRIARAGETSAVRLVREAGRLLGNVLAAVVNFYNPDTIVIGGDIAAAEEQLLAGVREVVYEHSTALATRSLKFAPSELGDRAGICGAAAMAIDRVLDPEYLDERLLRR